MVANSSPKITAKQQKDWIVSVLKENKAVVSLFKVDGTKRNLLCTLRKDLVPVYVASSKERKPQSDEVTSVWDIDSESWKSFKTESVIGIEIRYGN
jgi:hypothetical protein